MGVDAGTRMHAVIRERISEEPRGRALFIGEIATLAELLELAVRCHMQSGLIDAQPKVPPRGFEGRIASCKTVRDAQQIRTLTSAP